MALTLNSATATDVGPQRTNNEDAAFAGRRLLVIADGMGGMPEGEVASELVISALAPLEKTRQRDLQTALKRSIDTATDHIRAAIDTAAERTGMGTTLTALLTSPSGEQGTVVHVGDSRCYLYRNGALIRLTRDDSYVQTLIDQGSLTEEEARSHPKRGVITHAVQGQRIAPSITTIRRVEPGDCFLLCSDGLTDAVPDELITTTIKKGDDPIECARDLVRLALDCGTSDNVTAVVGVAEMSGWHPMFSQRGLRGSR